MLLMGDVGSGKTVVALFAMLMAVENGCQATLMAPRAAGRAARRHPEPAAGAPLVRMAQQEARALLAGDPALSGKEYVGLRRRIERRYERGVELFRVG